MRLGSFVVLALVIPSAAIAQRSAGRIGGNRPGQPVPLGRQPAVVARSVAMQRSRYAIETYPLLSRVVAPGYSGGRPISSWNSFGAGTRLDYRFTRFISLTGDITSSLYGGPAQMETAELGMRFHPEDMEVRIRPFADVRVGFEHSTDQFSDQMALGFGPASSLVTSERYSRGFGGVIGAGAEYSLTNTFSLTTGVSAMRTNMMAYSYSGTSVPTTGDRFAMTTYRLSIVLRYNPVYAIGKNVTAAKQD
jgi:hypothetical protein